MDELTKRTIKKAVSLYEGYSEEISQSRGVLVPPALGSLCHIMWQREGHEGLKSLVSLINTLLPSGSRVYLGEPEDGFLEVQLYKRVGEGEDVLSLAWIDMEEEIPSSMSRREFEESLKALLEHLFQMEEVFIEMVLGDIIPPKPKKRRDTFVSLLNKELRDFI